MATSGQDWIERAQGMDPTTAFISGLSGYILATWGAAIQSTRAFFDLLILTPVNAMIEVIWGSVDAFFLSQFEIPIAGAQVTIGNLPDLGLFASPGGIAITLFGITLVVWYLRREFSSDLIPGAVSDAPGPLGTDEDEQ